MVPKAAQKILAERATEHSSFKTSAKLLVFPARRDFKQRTLALYILLIAANIGAWAWALIAFRHYPVLLGTAVLAYSFGLRHAVDADHIAAIDNITRKLMNEGARPTGVGFFFSLGHSTVVALASAVLAFGAGVLAQVHAFKDIGGLIGTSVSAAFLFAIAIANIFILIGVYRAFERVRKGGGLIEGDLDELLSARGLLGRLFRPLFKLIRASWHMYLLGFLFGLGFDTATEIGVLGISAAQGSSGLPLASIMVFPALFTAGMALIDTTDSILMVGAYGWAYVKPLRKLYYNLTITGVSVLVALLVGSVEVLGLVGAKLDMHGAFWTLIARLNANFGLLGYAIVALFVVSWAASVFVYKLKGYDRLTEAPAE
ncbi:MAG TPA: HoxN/HupN/NixA family nickel/cobalt transporter [Micropepsaceae bacterium]|nr:HoxN/HupN/NixA family nickel/cobalt transporter [Micropepsaceae bacterium]